VLPGPPAWEPDLDGEHAFGIEARIDHVSRQKLWSISADPAGSVSVSATCTATIESRTRSRPPCSY
jgi:hypothetical protein